MGGIWEFGTWMTTLAGHFALLTSDASTLLPRCGLAGPH